MDIEAEMICEFGQSFLFNHFPEVVPTVARPAQPVHLIERSLRERSVCDRAGALETIARTSRREEIL